MLVIERAATASGETAASGIISPAQLRAATIAKQGRRSYARGKTEFDALARAGEMTMRQPPQSGTAPRTAVRRVIESTPALLGAGGGYAMTGDVTGALGGLVAGSMIPSVIGRGLLSAPMRNYLATMTFPQNRLPIGILGATTPMRLAPPTGP